MYTAPPPTQPVTTGSCPSGAEGCAGGPCVPGDICGGNLTCVKDSSSTGHCQEEAPCGGDGQACCIGATETICTTGFCLNSASDPTISTSGDGTCFSSPPAPPPQPPPCGYNGTRCCTIFEMDGSPSDPGTLCFSGNTCAADSLGGTCSGGQNPPEG